MDTRYEILNGVQETNSPKMVFVNHQMKVFKYGNGDVGKDDFFVVDLENVSNGVINERISPSNVISPHSRTILQRNLSRKMAHREIERKFDDKDGLSPSSSPRAAQAINKQEKSLPNTTNSINNNNLPQHQITIKTSDKKSILPEGRWGRRWSFKRSPPSWFYDPKKILLFFATMSSMGTMLLIYFTLSINKRGMKGVVLDWQ
ncbi:uncharacterized protein LOC141593015 isoform X2 [Silene latifolia]|uniref:uncharacterized protein LOC141593015 isoform X2 n=1 Tax=Silene latifolia TaxID=37657 RepID=UPI003D781187